MYYPIWRTTTYTADTDTLEYRIVYGADTVISSGIAARMPDEDNLIINLNGACKDYLNSLIYNELTGITESDEVVIPNDASGNFHLDVMSGGSWSTVYSWGFVNDWSFNSSVSAITSGAISEPINGHASSDMLIPYSYFLESGTTSVCYNIE